MAEYTSPSVPKKQYIPGCDRRVAKYTMTRTAGNLRSITIAVKFVVFGSLLSLGMSDFAKIFKEAIDTQARVSASACPRTP